MENNWRENWKRAKKELRALGIKVNVSVSGCCLGCSDKSYEDGQPAIYQLSKRFNNEYGGYLCHQNIADSDLAVKVLVVFNQNKIEWDWDGSQRSAIEISF